MSEFEDQHDLAWEDEDTYRALQGLLLGYFFLECCLLVLLPLLLLLCKAGQSMSLF